METFGSIDLSVSVINAPILPFQRISLCILCQDEGGKLRVYLQKRIMSFHGKLLVTKYDVDCRTSY